MLGADAYKALFDPNEYPIDQTVQVDNLLFRVIGVMEEKGGGPGGNDDNSIFLPLSTAQDRLFRQKTVSGDYQVSVIYASIISEERTQPAIDQISEILHERRNISYLDSDDFNVISQSDIISVFGDINRADHLSGRDCRH